MRLIDADALLKVFGHGVESYGEALQAIEDAPTVVDSELNKAVKLLGVEYKKAKKNPIVRNPITYALYYTWKHYTSRYEKKKYYK